MRTFKSSNRAFSLIEVLVTVAIIAILSAVLLPSLAQARRSTQTTVCLSNLHQMVTAAHTYTLTYKEYYPFAFGIPKKKDRPAKLWWNYFGYKDPTKNNSFLFKPGFLWQGIPDPQINQCPSFNGISDQKGLTAFGYNYNTSYIGGTVRYFDEGPPKIIQKSSRTSDVRRPYECALFGDGAYFLNPDSAPGQQYSENRWMRSPFAGRDEGPDVRQRCASTQDYRHLEKTNVAFSDGHARSLRKRSAIVDTYDDAAMDLIISFYGDHIKYAKTGFLSPDNSLYDLE